MSSSSESEDATPLKQKKCDLHFKQEVVAYAEKYNKSKAAKVKNVNSSFMCQRLDETESTARSSVESVSVIFHLFKQAPRCRTSFEGQGFRREANQMGSSATSEETPCQPHDDSERGAYFVDRRKFQGKQWLVGKVFASSQLGLTPPNDDLSEGAGGVR